MRKRLTDDDIRRRILLVFTKNKNKKSSEWMATSHIAADAGLHYYKVEKILDLMEIEHLIESQELTGGKYWRVVENDVA